jgi:uncharacterized protein (DUF1697 family)
MRSRRTAEEQAIRSSARNGATRYAAFLRAINVGGHVVKMERLRTIFEELGLANVSTFIASGNVLFDAQAKRPAALEQKIGKALRAALGYDVAVFLRTAAEVNAICARCGEPPAEGTLMVGFLPTEVDAREQKLIAAMSTPVDKVFAENREVFWHAKERFSGSIFQPAKLERQLGKPVTFRNVNTVRRIAALLAKSAARG